MTAHLLTRKIAKFQCVLRRKGRDSGWIRTIKHGAICRVRNNDKLWSFSIATEGWQNSGALKQRSTTTHLLPKAYWRRRPVGWLWLGRRRCRRRIERRGRTASCKATPTKREDSKGIRSRTASLLPSKVPELKGAEGGRGERGERKEGGKGEGLGIRD